MNLKNHGGKCCGVKHLYNLPMYPHYPVPAINEREVKHGAAAEMSVSSVFFGESAPLEKGSERLERLLKYITSKKKEGHIVEVVLSAWQNTHWQQLLEDSGFVLSVSGNNCNTVTTIYVYHLVLPLKPKKEKEK